MKKSLLFLVVSALLWGGAATAQAEIVSGKFGADGENLTWTFNTETGSLEISGKGSMGEDYFYAPWSDYSYDIVSVKIGDGVTTIGDNAFYLCEGLTSITIPESVTSIGDHAFCGCTGLTSITIPNSVTTIGESAFSVCEGLKTVTIPNSVTSIGSAAFSGCTGLENFEGKFAINHRSLVVNDTLVAFAPSGLTQYTLPDKIKVIGHDAFQNCYGLKSVTIGKGVTTIDGYAFYGCTGLNEVWFNADSCISGGFEWCEALATVHIGENVKQIPAAAFSGCSGLTEITIPNSVTTIGKFAFSNCGLKTATIGEGVTTIGEWAFSGCTGLEKFEGKLATPDYRCLVVRDTLVAFAPSGLTQYTIPDNVKVIGNDAFSYCRGLTSVTIPESVTSIGEDAFYECESLTSVTIPNSVTTIGDYAFESCGLTSVTIGKNVQTIGRRAFSRCTSLKSVIAYNPKPVDTVVREWFDSYFAFEDVDYANCTLYVPAESVNEYQLAEGWSEFGEILPIDESSSITETQQEQAVERITVYNLQGVLVLETNDAADLKTLQNGAYIVNGKTMIIAR